MKHILFALILIATTAAHAYPWWDRGHRWDYDRGYHYPPPPSTGEVDDGDQRIDDLCSGTYRGVYQNGRSFTMTLGRTGLVNVQATITYFGRDNDIGEGLCEMRADGSATIELRMEKYPDHFATINQRGVMNGAQKRGVSFRANRVF